MQRYGVFSNAPNILQKSCSGSALGENNSLHTDMTYRNKSKGSWGDEDRPLLGTNSPPAIFSATKKMILQKENDIKQLMKTENRTDENKRLNGCKQKTELVKTANWTDENRTSNGWKQKTQRMKIENSTVENAVFGIRKILTTAPNTRIFATKRVIGCK